MNPKQMLARLGECNHFTLLGKATLENYVLVFDVPDYHAKGAGYANIRKKKGSLVHGLLYDLDETALSILDRYEHVPELYIRTKIIVFYKENPVQSYIYLGNTKKKSKSTLRPTSRYLNRILLGSCYVPESYSKSLRETKTCPDPGFDAIKQ